MPILLYSLLAIHVIMCALMILVTLMQRPRSEGLGAAFGGGMTDNMFGAQTTNVLAKFTTWLGGLFFVVTLVLAMLYARAGSGGDTKIQQELKNLPAPAAATVPAASEAVAPIDGASPTTSEPTEAVAPVVGEISTDASDAVLAPAPAAAEPVADSSPLNSLVIPSPAPVDTRE